MSAASIPPENLALFGALAIGGYWLMTRRVGATGLPAGIQFGTRTNIPAANAGAGSPAIYQANDSALWGGVAKILGNLWQGGGSTKTASPNVYQQANAGNSGGSNGTSSSTGDPYMTTSEDGVAANPVYSSVYDYSKEFWY